MYSRQLITGDPGAEDAVPQVCEVCTNCAAHLHSV